MKFSPEKWTEIENDKEISSEIGRLWVRSSQISCLFVTSYGHEVLASVGYEHDLEVCQIHSFRVEAPVGARSFIFSPYRTVGESQGEIFTNPDVARTESPALRAVREEMRLFELQRRQARREVDQTLQELRAARAAVAAPIATQEVVPQSEKPDDPAGDSAASE